MVSSTASADADYLKEIPAERRAVVSNVGKKLDMGKSCLHFKKLDDLPLDVIAHVVGSTSVEDYIQRYESARKR